jgi:hypothetical protein
MHTLSAVGSGSNVLAAALWFKLPPVSWLHEVYLSHLPMRDAECNSASCTRLYRGLLKMLRCNHLAGSTLLVADSLPARTDATLKRAA